MVGAMPSPFWLLALLGCADPPEDTDPADSGEPDPDDVQLDGPCPLDEAFGGFDVEEGAITSFAGGAVTDGVVPISILTEVGSEGDCILLRRENPFCDPGCDSDQTCDFDGRCIPYPEQRDVGTVTIDGLAEAVVMEPGSPGYSYYDVDLPDPVWVPGSLITLSSTGGDIEPLLLYGVGVDPLELAADFWFVLPDTDYVIDWVAPTQAGTGLVHLRMNIDQHGTTPVVLECTFGDVGSGVVPGALMRQFVSFGVTGYPSAQIERRTVDSTAIDPGCVDFEVTSVVNPEVDLDGYTPCAGDEDCPDPETCNTDLEICE